jgi:hypothetical protein
MLSTEFEYRSVAGPFPEVPPVPSDAQDLGLPSCPMVAPTFWAVAGCKVPTRYGQRKVPRFR